MARKPLTKKEIDFYEEETSSRHVTKVLWSRDGNEYFSDQEFVQEIGDTLSETEGTVSSCSWGFDEFEIKSTKRIQASLDAIEEALYDGNKDPILSPELYEECQKWSKKFPNLRLKGKKAVPTNVDSSDSEFHHHQSDKVSTLSHDESSFRKIRTANSDSTNQSTPVLVRSDAIDHDDEEEIIAQDGNYENDIHVDKRQKSCDRESVSDLDTNFSRKNSFSVEYIKEKVIEQLASEVWSEVLSRWGKSRGCEGCEDSEEQNDYLPPITSKEKQTQLSFSKPWTSGKTPKTSDFPRLDGILTVSPKILQKRNGSRIGSGASRRTRPNTGVSVLSYSSIESFHNPCLPKRCTKSQEKSASGHPTLQSIQKRPLEKDADLLNLYLPVLDENTPMIHNRLRGDLDIKETFSKLRFPEASSFPVKPCFLPPIEDRDTNGDLQRPISYESHLPSGKKHSHSNVYTRHLNKISARPSTTRTSWGMKNPSLDATRHKDISSLECQSLLSVSNKKMATENVDNLVSLFPIVTSLEPKQLNDKSKNQNFSRKNSLLSAFGQKDKR